MASLGFYRLSNANACIYCFEILLLTYSDFTFGNVNFDLRKFQFLNKYYNFYLYVLFLNKLFLLVNNAFIKVFVGLVRLTSNHMFGSGDFLE